eukprot:TRINITY_DN10279_c0_g1_i1.p1 TRINITY_DN10279_c0_g1~~TRINITY_DN10279_c0_g1_i1.p1  ORF type:complete len:881 (+),score=115.89 TRINITY_DN10279_c0_g1_i1:64-2706(+)
MSHQNQRKRRRHPCTYQHNVCRHKFDCWHLDVDAAICTYWMTAACKKGEACEYVHSKDEDKLRLWWKKRVLPEHNVDKDKTWSRSSGLEASIPVRSLLVSEAPYVVLRTQDLPLWSSEIAFIEGNYKHHHSNDLLLLVVDKLPFLAMNGQKIQLSSPNKPPRELPSFILSLALHVFDFTDEPYFSDILYFLCHIKDNITTCSEGLHTCDSVPDLLSKSLTRILPSSGVCDIIIAMFEMVFKAFDITSYFDVTKVIPNGFVETFLPSQSIDESLMMYTKRRDKVLNSMMNLLVGHLVVPLVRFWVPGFEVFGREGVVWMSRRNVLNNLADIEQGIAKYGIPEVITQFLDLIGREWVTVAEVRSFCKNNRTTATTMISRPRWATQLINNSVSQYLPESADPDATLASDIAAILYNGLVTVITCNRSTVSIPTVITQRHSHGILSDPCADTLPKLYSMSDLVLVSSSTLLFSVKKRPVVECQSRSPDGIHPDLISEFVCTVKTYPAMEIQTENGSLRVAPVDGRSAARSDHSGYELQQIMLRAISHSDDVPPTIVVVDVAGAVSGCGMRSGDYFYLKENITSLDVECLGILKEQESICILEEVAVNGGRNRPKSDSLLPHQRLTKVCYVAFTYLKMRDLLQRSDADPSQRALISVFVDVTAVAVILTGGDKVRTCTAITETTTKPSFLGGLADVSMNLRKDDGFSEPTDFFPNVDFPKPVHPKASIGGLYDIDSNFEIFTPPRNPPKCVLGNGPAPGLNFLENELSNGAAVILDRGINSVQVVHSNLYQLLITTWRLIPTQVFNAGLLRHTVVKITDILNRHLITSPLDTSCFRSIATGSCLHVLQSWEDDHSQLVEMAHDMLDDCIQSCETCKLLHIGQQDG